MYIMYFFFATPLSLLFAYFLNIYYNFQTDYIVYSRNLYYKIVPLNLYIYHNHSICDYKHLFYYFFLYCLIYL